MDWMPISKKNGLEYFSLPELKMIQIVSVSSGCCAFAYFDAIVEYLEDNNIQKQPKQSVATFIENNFNAWYKYFEHKFAFQEDYYLTKDMSETDSDDEENDWMCEPSIIYIGQLEYVKPRKSKK